MPAQQIISKPLPDYSNPPVIEVVCGISFTPLVGFQAVHLGLLWEKFRDQYPKVEEHPPVVMPLEQLTIPAGHVETMQFLETPPLPRVWFLDVSGNGIVQVQRDVLLYNWRKLKDTDKYPRFSVVIREFKDHLLRLVRFVEAEKLGAIQPVQYELTYINHVPATSHWSHGKPLNSIFPDFVWRQSRERFLPMSYEAAHWRTAFRLPDDNGRLHVAIQTAFKRPDNAPLLILELKARGMARDHSMASAWKWFDLAHEWIVRGFADITDRTVQESLWGLKS
ncbi:MAG TPA: TIGR04255 family protein [Burkholderiales bacterium]|nr:TIGR04255 family protein [Burkholderiales bacterium]